MRRIRRRWGSSARSKHGWPVDDRASEWDTLRRWALLGGLCRWVRTGVPAGRALVTLVMVCGLAAPASAQYWVHFGRNKIQYEKFDWQVLKTEHFDIYFYPEMQELAGAWRRLCGRGVSELQNRFHLSLSHRPPIIFYSSNLHFKQTNITDGFIPDGVGGFFEFLKGRVVIPANGKPAPVQACGPAMRWCMSLRSARSRACIATIRIAPDRFLPLWFTEGLAEYWSGEPDFQHEMVMRDAIYSNLFTPLQNMYRINGTFVMYKEGEALCRFMAETYGEEKLLELMDNVWRDRIFARSWSTCCARTTQCWESAAGLVAPGVLPKLEGAEVPTLMSGVISARGFNSKPVVYRRQDGRRQVFFVANRSGYGNVYRVDVDSMYRPLHKPDVLVRGERGNRFEAFHLLESRLSISDGCVLAFVTKSGGKDVIHTYDLEADALGPAYEFDDLVAVYSPSWSPDGTKLVFTSIDPSGHSDLYVFDTEGGGLQRASPTTCMTIVIRPGVRTDARWHFHLTAPR